MLNPSTADAMVDDPTIRRVIGFAKDWGYGSALVGNLFAYRATDPKELKQRYDAVGEENDYYLSLLARLSDKIIVAWGSMKYAKVRARAVVHLLRDRQLQCLGKTKDGSPRHPLYVKKDIIVEPYR